MCISFPGVALLPFVDERRLRAALEEVYPDLTPEESKNYHLVSTLSLYYTTLHFPMELDTFRLLNFTQGA